MLSLLESEVDRALRECGSGLIPLGGDKYHVIDTDSPTGDVCRYRVDALPGDPVVWSLADVAKWAGIPLSDGEVGVE